MTDPKISFIGLGHMNSAILAGYLAAGHDPAQIRATVSSEESAARARKRFPEVEIIPTVDDPTANSNAVQWSEIVVVGTTPAQLPNALGSLSPGLGRHAVVVSIAAGISLDTLETNLPAGQPIIRTMPNLPLTVGLGVVGLVCGEHVTDDQVAAVNAIFETSGKVFEVPENQINLVGALAGSGPGHVFHFTDLMAQAATQLGLDEEVARQMARLTVAGSGAMLAEEGADAARLRGEIMTPNGTTEASINSLNESGLDEILLTALRANVARSEAIGRGE